MYKQLDSAIAFAATAHAGQLRKYDGLPYIVHPIEVMTIVHAVANDEDMLVAAVLHDVVEDTPVNFDTIVRRFGVRVGVLVGELTDDFTSEAYPHMNRRARKDAEAARMATISPEAQTIKYADLISNTKSIVAFDPGFARTYLKEKELILRGMRAGNPTLLREVEHHLVLGQQALVQEALR